MTDQWDSLIHQMNHSVHRSQMLASDVQQINRLQTKQLEQYQTTMDKSSKHLKDVEEEIKEIEQGFCMRLCCSAKNKKVKSKNIDKTQRDDEGDSAFSVEHDSIYTNNQLDNLDANLQKLQYFNRLIDREFENQIETLNHLHHQVDLNSHKLNKANVKTKHF